MRKQKTDHVVAIGDSDDPDNPFRFQCNNCGERFVIIMGTTISVVTKGMTSFLKMHKLCKPKQEARK